MVQSRAFPTIIKGLYRGRRLRFKIQMCVFMLFLVQMCELLLLLVQCHKILSLFYFTNVPDDISYNCLSQGFEVCGIMEDVYLAKKRNINSGVFGFGRYSKVKDVDKLLKALNNVWFGDCKVVAKVASFDRFGNKKDDVRVIGEGEKIKDGEKSKVGGGGGW